MEVVVVPLAAPSLPQLAYDGGDVAAEVVVVAVVANPNRFRFMIQEFVL